MCLPLIIRSSEQALLSVAPGLRHASYALGVGKLKTIFKVVLPGSIGGILTGVLLAIGRIVGESACLIFTLGTNSAMLSGLTSSSRTLAVHMYMLSNEGLHVKQAQASAAVLLLLVLIINYFTSRLFKRFKGVTNV